MKILFLDIDGVMNSLKGSPGRKFSEPCIDHLKDLLKDKDIEIVISSSWRHLGLDEMKALFKENGLPSDRIVDITGNESGSRGNQIKCWLERNKSPKSFAILDDNSDMQPNLTKLVKTNSFVGLTKGDVEKVKKLLHS